MFKHSLFILLVTLLNIPVALNCKNENINIVLIANKYCHGDLYPVLAALARLDIRAADVTSTHIGMDLIKEIRRQMLRS